MSKAIATGLDGALLLVERFAAKIDPGVHGSIDGQNDVLGNHRWTEDRKQCPTGLEAPMHAPKVLGRTVTVLLNSEGVLALFAVADTEKASSKDPVAGLRPMGVATVMITGDNQATVNAIADHVGIADVRANLLPQGKVDAIKALAAAGRSVGMAGDGLNDAPAMSTAHVAIAIAIAIAMGVAGTDTAMEAAGVLNMN